MSQNTTLPQLLGDFPISSQENVYKQSSTAWLAITFILFLGYTVAKIIANRKTQYGADKQQEVPKIIKNFLKVVEYDLAPSLLIFYFMIGLGEFYIFAAVFGYFLLITTGILVLAYHKNAFKVIMLLRILVVVLTVCAFLNIFIDSMNYSDAYSDILSQFANGGNNTTSSSSSSGSSSSGDASSNSTNNSTAPPDMGAGRLL